MEPKFEIGIEIAKLPDETPIIPKGQAEEVVRKQEVKMQNDEDTPDKPEDKPVELPRSIVWEVPPHTSEVHVEIYNHDNSFNTSYTITDFIQLSPGQKLKVIAR